jgi:hypothetical protein
MTPTKLNGEQVEQMRRSAFFLLDTMLPFKDTDAAYKEICKDYGGAGTTCGFLCHWLMWRLGVADKTRVNRDAPGYTYRPGDNLSRIVQAYKPPFVKTFGTKILQTGKRPKKGDICYIYQAPDGAQNTEHVFCMLRDAPQSGVWDTAEAGQDYGRWGRKREDRMLFLESTGAKITGNTPIRTLMGWLPLDELEYVPPPKALPFPFL